VLGEEWYQGVFESREIDPDLTLELTKRRKEKSYKRHVDCAPDKFRPVLKSALSTILINRTAGLLDQREFVRMTRTVFPTDIDC
jgi:hypothetical protein